ncbi:YbjN domain-containing protein [Phenylobacterium sp.]|jgi:hypothetical protein|uniref:YbjN domain-containing protein n=1 Tax=Phenylobacterium sp. TaxID=1871053 RepID=UPI002E31F65E|nr:YbjN domain-containing protein [Phenylobacterium sp.]HEX2560812.1 YbjN domain-containing protein [Phenylobacterium sp.]
MVTKRLLTAIAVLTLVAAPIAAPAQTKPAPKAAAKAAPKPAPNPASGRFDARDPAGLVDVLAAMDAKAEVARKGDEEVHLSVSTSGVAFGAQFAGCDANGKACKALAFNAAADKRSATLAQVNNFNQTSMLCRAYQDKAGKMNVVYATLLGAGDTREDMRMHIGAWQTCLGTFGRFLQDPTGYLAAAP